MARCVVMDANRIAVFPDFANLPAEELNDLAGAMTEVEVEAVCHSHPCRRLRIGHLPH